MKATEINITKKQFDSFVRVQESNRYNMMTEMGSASKEANLTTEEWCYILDNYDSLDASFPREHKPTAKRTTPKKTTVKKVVATKSTAKKLSKDEIISSKQDTINKLNELGIQAHGKIRRLKEERDAYDKIIGDDDKIISDLRDEVEDYWEENKKLKADLKSLETKYEEVVSELRYSSDKRHDLKETLYEGRQKVDDLDWCFNLSSASNAKQLAKGRPAIASLASFLLQAREDYCLKYYGVDVEVAGEKKLSISGGLFVDDVDEQEEK